MVQETGPVTFNFEGQPLYHLLGSYTRYSSWTARVATVLEYFRIPYRATYIPLAEVKTTSPSGLVPLLTPLQGPAQGIQLNDSLGILLFIAEEHPEKPLFPRDLKLRALARSAVAEMHSGFPAVRNKFDSNFIGIYTGTIPITEVELKEINRLLTIFNQARKATSERSVESGIHDEGYLFGAWGIVDAFFWPVLWRFRTYNLPLGMATPATLEYIKKIWEDPIIKAISDDYFAQLENPETSIPLYDDKWKDDPNVDALWGIVPKDWKFSINTRVTP